MLRNRSISSPASGKSSSSCSVRGISTSAFISVSQGRCISQAITISKFSTDSHIRNTATASVSRQMSASLTCRSTSAVMPVSAQNDELQVSRQMGRVLDYAFEFANASETYEVNSWMLLLGILKNESCTAAKALKELGLDDLYGAWHEVLWAMNVVDALEPRPATFEVGFADRAFHVLVGATSFAEWGGRSKVQTEDLLMSLAAGKVLEGLFPDLKLDFDRVRKAVEKVSGGVYVLPDDDENAESKISEEDNFL